jgi:myo-inositol-1(or 4)-monophosphatase
MKAMARAELERIRDAAVDIALTAGELLGRRFRKLGAADIQFKGARDMVTTADREAQDHVVERLARSFPDHLVVAEEDAGPGATRPRPAAALTWYVDPLDGTTNFVHGLPDFAVSMGLFRGTTPLVGVVHAPALGETFHAVRGGGAWLGDRRIRVSRVRTLVRSLLTTGFACVRDGLVENNLGNFNRLVTECQGIRRLGSAALDMAYVAAGRFDAFWELALAPWDTAGAAVLVLEAGGRITELDGGGAWLFGKNVLATNGRIHAELASRLARERSERQPARERSERQPAPESRATSPGVPASADLAGLAHRIAQFVAEREWQRYHTPKNLAMAVAVEAAELMEIFQWLDPDQSDRVRRDRKLRARVEGEMADVLAYLLSLANRLDIDLASALAHKMEKNRRKYPADKFRGRSGRREP